MKHLTAASAASGYFRSGLPWTRTGAGPRVLVVFPGLTFENRPQFGMLFMYRFLKKEYTLYSVFRRPDMPGGYTLNEMAADYAVMVREEFGGPVDVLGISTGGSIALHFAADHPDLVHRLIIHSSAHALNEKAKQLQMEVARLAQQKKWRQAWALLIATMYPQSGPGKQLSLPLVQLSAWMLSRKPPGDPGDLVATVEAEDKHAFRERLAEIAAPTLVAGGINDFFYSPELFRETAEGIPNAELRLYEGKGHPAGGRQFRKDVLSFLHRQSTG